MNAVWMRSRADLRARRWGWLALAVMLGVFGGGVVAVAAGPAYRNRLSTHGRRLQRDGDIRELRDRVGFRPSEGRFKIYIIDEVHMLSMSAFNALLKTLEEPPPHARFILATTEPHKIPATILSRCQRFDFRRIPAAEIAEHLQHIVAAEGYRAEDEGLLAIARSAQGCMRDAISLLDQMLSYGTQVVTLAQVQQVLGTVSAQSIAELVDAIAARDAAAGLRLIQQLVTDGAGLLEFCQQVVEYLRGVMVLAMTGEPELLHELPNETIVQMQRQAQQMAAPATLFAIKRFSEAVPQLKGGNQAQLPLELALIEVVRGEAVVAVATADGTAAVAAGHAGSVGQPAAQATIAPAAHTPAAGQVAAAVTANDATAAPSGPDGAATIPQPLDSAAIQRLRNRWKDILNVVREQCGYQVQAALNTVRDIAVADQAVALAFGANTFTRDMVAKPETHKQISAILADFLGRSIQLDCQIR